jgi:hypothetical protein
MAHFMRLNGEYNEYEDTHTCIARDVVWFGHGD